MSTPLDMVERFIEAHPQLERAIWDAAFILTFGTPEQQQRTMDLLEMLNDLRQEAVDSLPNHSGI